jgi:hypothetical protein
MVCRKLENKTEIQNQRKGKSHHYIFHVFPLKFFVENPLAQQLPHGSSPLTSQQVRDKRD